MVYPPEDSHSLSRSKISYIESVPLSLVTRRTKEKKMKSQNLPLQTCPMCVDQIPREPFEFDSCKCGQIGISFVLFIFFAYLVPTLLNFIGCYQHMLQIVCGDDDDDSKCPTCQVHVTSTR